MSQICPFAGKFVSQISENLSLLLFDNGRTNRWGVAKNLKVSSSISKEKFPVIFSEISKNFFQTQICANFLHNLKFGWLGDGCLNLPWLILGN